MSGLSIWWRRFGAAFAALVIAVLAVGPSLDALVCRDDGSGSAAAVQTAVADADGYADGPDHPGGPAACVHGHCHHSAPVMPPAALDAAYAPAAASHTLLRLRVATTDPKFELNRPPRA